MKTLHRSPQRKLLNQKILDPNRGWGEGTKKEAALKGSLSTNKTNYFLAVANRLLTSSQLTTFHQAAR
jgi:hypothetical protein